MNSIFEKTLSLKGRGGKTFSKMQNLDQRLGCPWRYFRSIHVAGTNGKGSVSLKIASVLENSGYKVGLFTSPHIWSVQERMRINGEVIAEDKLKDLLTRVYDPELSFFDCLTAAAFLYFKAEKVDYAVIETGLGGRFDATNVLMPELAIITSIGHDHSLILGETLEQIAFEKGGIAKVGVPLIVGPSAAPFFPNAIHVKEEPNYELENRQIARKALQLLHIHSEVGLEITPRFRFEKIGEMIFDAAHNPLGFQKLKEMLQLHFPGRQFPFYLAFSQTKDWQSCIETISPVASSIQMIESTNPRLIQNYPGFTTVSPESIKRGVVAGSIYIFSELIQSNEGALALSHV